jgi:L-alanine-DL-glutamate epimerase-like enolase superfamily enzyme
MLQSWPRRCANSVLVSPEAPLLPEENVEGHRELLEQKPGGDCAGETERTRYQFKSFIEKRVPTFCNRTWAAPASAS